MNIPKKSGLYLATHMENGYRIAVNVVLDGHLLSTRVRQKRRTDMIKPNSEVVNVFRDEDRLSVEGFVYGKCYYFLSDLDEYDEWEEIPSLSDEVRGTLPEESLADLPDGYYYDREG